MHVTSDNLNLVRQVTTLAVVINKIWLTLPCSSLEFQCAMDDWNRSLSSCLDVRKTVFAWRPAHFVQHLVTRSLDPRPNPRGR